MDGGIDLVVREDAEVVGGLGGKAAGSLVEFDELDPFDLEEFAFFVDLGGGEGARLASA